MTQSSTASLRVAFPEGTSLYGAGQAAGPLRRVEREIHCWNTDAYRYDGETTQAFYQSHPFVLAVLPDGRAVGLYADCSRRGWIGFGTCEVEFRFQAEHFELERIEADHPLEVCRALASRVGRMELPPLWALGYHQCRWSYASAEEVRSIAAGFRRHRIPCDAIWLDIDYMDRYRVFTWNRERFPDPAGLTEALRDIGIRCVAILDPGVAVAEDYPPSAEGLAGGHFVREASGTPFVGPVWPGPCHFPDFSSARTRDWWSGQVERFTRAARLDGLWIDMNEPALLHGASPTLPDDARHEAATHAEVHNLYGQQMAEATREGFKRAYPDRRPFLLTRSNHITGARFAATWTGDNQSDWAHLRWSISMTLNLGLCGQAFAGADVGGFEGEPSPELFVRWFTLGALLPFFRGHAERSTDRREPWSYGAAVLSHVRTAIERRQRLLPHLYTLFREASETGAPIVRPVFFADPSDPRLREIDDCFLLGDALLVAPVVEPGARRRVVVLPEVPGGWCSLADGRWHRGTVEVAAPLGALPIYARAGRILVECEPALSAARGFGETLTYRVFLGAGKRADGRLYEDAGDGHDHRQGRYRDTVLRADVQGPAVRIQEDVTGAWESASKRRRILVYGPGGRAEWAGTRANLYRIEI